MPGEDYLSRPAEDALWRHSDTSFDVDIHRDAREVPRDEAYIGRGGADFCIRKLRQPKSCVRGRLQMLDLLT